MARNRLKVCMLISVAVVLGVFVIIYREGETPSAEGTLVFTVGTRLPEGALAGLRGGVQVGSGRGIWKQSLENPSQQAEQIETCVQRPWIANTDVSNHFVFGCGRLGYLYDAHQKRRFRLQISDGEVLIALSTRGSFAVFASQGKMLVKKYKIVNSAVFWLEKYFVPNTPSPDTIHFSPKGNTILIESGGWTYLLPALGEGAVKVFQAHAIGWMPDGVCCVVYDRARHTLLLYDMRSDRIAALSMSQYLTPQEVPVAVSPTGQFIATVRTRFDYRRLLPEVRTLCVRSVANPQQEHCIDIGWDFIGVCWLSSN